MYVWMSIVSVNNVTVAKPLIGESTMLASSPHLFQVHIRWTRTSKDLHPEGRFDRKMHEWLWGDSYGQKYLTLSRWP
jgi:hypothetical protein